MTYKTINQAVRLSALQLCSVPNVEQNLIEIERLIAQLTQQYPSEKDGQHIVVLPECCLYFGGKDSEQLTLIDAITSQYIRLKLAQLACDYSVYLVAGTIPLAGSVDNKFTASSLLFSADGKQLSEYQKMHLFDVQVNDNSKNYHESKYTEAGQSVVVTQLGDVSLGMSVCYDLRFPELFRSMTSSGANVIALPAAFTRVTGQAHWQSLLQARAIENQVYMVAAAQEGVHANGRETWGHAMIVSPWGEVLDCLEQGAGWVSTHFDGNFLNDIRQNIPQGKHNQFTVTKITR